MKRTMRRPLPSGRITLPHAVMWASSVGVAGTALLAWKVAYYFLIYISVVSSTFLDKLVDIFITIFIVCLELGIIITSTDKFLTGEHAGSWSWSL